MSKLLDALREDPEASFQLECTLPSGNVMRGVIGPMVGARVACNIRFDNNPASQQDVLLAKEIINRQMGALPEISMVTENLQEHNAARVAVRRFLGGGQG